MTPQDIYNRYKLGIPGAFETVGEADEAILAAIQEAFNVNATRIAELEKINQELRETAKELVHLHLCEQEGLSSGQPTMAQWLKAVDDLSNLLHQNLQQ